MKKLLLFGLTTFLLVQPFSARAEEGSVVITHAQGSPMILRNGSSMPAKTGGTCQTGDKLTTGGECTVDIAVNQTAGCRLLPSSECSIVDSSKSSMHLNVTNGNAVLNLDKLPQDTSFKLETPTAIASVRGTQFWGRVDLQHLENPVTTFAVRRGTVDVFAKSAGKNFSLVEGQALDIPKDASTSPNIRPALAGELQAMEQADAIRTSA